MAEEEIGMTADEIQRYLEQQAEQGVDEVDAYRSLMEVLGVETPRSFDN